MSISTTFLASDGSDEPIVIERNRLWENVHIYYEGELIKTFRYASETREGVLFNIENLGTISLKVHSVSLEPTLLVNGKSYLSEDYNGRPRKRLLKATVVFGILSVFNLVFFLKSAEEYVNSPDWHFAIFVLFVSGFYLVSYIITTIFLARKIYFFYFYGTGIFTISTLYVLALVAFNEVHYIFLTMLVARIIILILLLRFFKRAIRLLQAQRVDKEPTTILDNDL